jgi:thiamine-phosphate pyrophosphorylase
MSQPVRISGLYAITPDEPDTGILLHKVRRALAGGTRWLQYRNKLADPNLQREQAAALRTLTRTYAARLIINDDPDLALAVDADGVHLGAEDQGIAAARVKLGAGKIIGASCYNRPPLAFEAEAQGADYVAFGAFFPSGVKPGAVRAEVDLLRQVRSEFSVPVVAIGGITLDNAPQLLAAGADALAVISGVFAVPDVEQAARSFSNLFRQDRQA